MSLDFFPATMVRGVLSESIPFKNMTRAKFMHGRYVEDVLNTDYVPGSMVNLATVNGKKILSSMGKNLNIEDSYGFWELSEFKAAYADATNSCELSARYIEPFTDLFKVCEEVGATHIMCI